jgi:hypothetical protein
MGSAYTMDDEISPVGLKPTRPEQITLESWSQGFMVGSLIIMAAITLGNMRSGVMLHKLILIEVCPTLTILPCSYWPVAHCFLN